MYSVSINRAYKVADFLSWHRSSILKTKPKYQRNLVWNNNAKSYLIDSIVKGFPISQIFIREDQNIETLFVEREIVDGQQRISTILKFVNDDFKMLRIHNSEYGGKFFSDLPDEVKASILSYEIPCQVLSTDQESIIHSVFSRLNNVNYVLNKQELRNANYFGIIKTLVEKIREEIFDEIKNFGLYSETEIVRMKLEEDISRIMMYFVKGFTDDSDPNINKFYAENDNNESLENDSTYENVLNSIKGALKLFNEIKVYNGGVTYFDRKFLFTFCVLVDKNNKFSEKQIGILSKLDIGMFSIRSKKKKNKKIYESFEENEIDLFSQIYNLHTSQTNSKSGKEQRVAIIQGLLNEKQKI